MDYEIKTMPLEIKSIENGTFKGYASTFGGKPDSYGDIIEAGAFTDTLAKGGKHGKIPMLWQHDMDKPIGVWTSLKENARGLLVEGKLSLGSSLGKDAYELMKDEALDAMSIGWEVYDRDSANVSIDEKNRTRRLKKIDLWEISLVTLGANPRAKISDVKSLIESARTERELEDAFMDIGMSRKASQYIVSLCKGSLKKEEMPEEGLLKILKLVNADLTKGIRLI